MTFRLCKGKGEGTPHVVSPDNMAPTGKCLACLHQKQERRRRRLGYKSRVIWPVTCGHPGRRRYVKGMCVACRSTWRRRQRGIGPRKFSGVDQKTRQHNYYLANRDLFIARALDWQAKNPFRVLLIEARRYVRAAEERLMEVEAQCKS